MLTRKERYALFDEVRDNMQAYTDSAQLLAEQVTKLEQAFASMKVPMEPSEYIIEEEPF